MAQCTSAAHIEKHTVNPLTDSFLPRVLSQYDSSPPFFSLNMGKMREGGKLPCDVLNINARRSTCKMQTAEAKDSFLFRDINSSVSVLSVKVNGIAMTMSMRVNSDDNDDDIKNTLPVLAFAFAIACFMYCHISNAFDASNRQFH